MKFYVAGASKEIDRAESVMAALRNAGHEITFDWCAAIRNEAAGGKSDRDLTFAECLRYANLDRLGVQTCNWFWLLVPEGTGIGAWVELGIAIDHCAATMASGDLGKSIFLTQVNERFSSDVEALAWVQDGFGPRAARGTP